MQDDKVRLDMNQQLILCVLCSVTQPTFQTDSGSEPDAPAMPFLRKPKTHLRSHAEQALRQREQICQRRPSISQILHNWGGMLSGLQLQPSQREGDANDETVQPQTR